jgi:mRNA interferase MazF
MGTSSDYRLGSIWLIRFDPSIGTEIRKTRPAVIISGTAFNQRSKVTVLPLTTSQPRDRRLLSIVVPIAPSDSNGLDADSFLICIDPVTFDKRRLVQYLGQLEEEQTQQAKAILRRYLELD